MSFICKEHDEKFYSVTFTCWVIFLSEFSLQILFREKYLGSFTFFMDFISTVSLIFDIPWLSESIFGFNFNGILGVLK